MTGAVQVVTHVRRIAFEDGLWILYDREGREIVATQVLCLAGGVQAADLASGARLSPVRGQVSFAASDLRPGAAIGGGYLIPTLDGYLFGATHDRGDTDTAVRSEDHQRNLALIASLGPAVARAAAEAPLQGRAGVRAATPDFLPLAGAVPGSAPGLFILSGLGSRGFCTAPLLAEHVAALALGAPSPLPRALAEIVDPARFELRLARKGRPRTDPADQ